MAKKTGHKTEFSIDTVKIAYVRSIKPSSKTRDTVDVTDLDSAIEELIDEDVIKMGPVDVSVYWHPGETNGAIAETLFDEEAQEDRVGVFEIRYPKFTPVVTDTFSGVIVAIEPEEIAMKNAIGRKITIQPTTVITRATEA